MARGALPPASDLVLLFACVCTARAEGVTLQMGWRAERPGQALPELSLGVIKAPNVVSGNVLRDWWNADALTHSPLPYRLGRGGGRGGEGGGWIQFSLPHPCSLCRQGQVQE